MTLQRGGPLEMVFDLCGGATVADGTLLVRLPARTLECEGETVVYQRRVAFPPDALSPLERRDRDPETLAEEYEALVEAHGERGLALVDGASRPAGVVVHGVLNHRGKNLGSVEPLSAAAEQTVRDRLSE